MTTMIAVEDSRVALKPGTGCFSTTRLQCQPSSSFHSPLCYTLPLYLVVLASGRAESFLCAPEFWCAPGPLRRHPRFAFPLFLSATLLYCSLSYRRLFIGRLPSLQSTKQALLLKQSASEAFGRTESHSWQGSHVAAAGWSRVDAS